MKIVLLSTPLKDKAFPSLGLAYIVSVLNANGHECSMHDGANASFQDMIDYVEKEKPKLVGLSMTTNYRFEVLELAKAIKEKFGCLIMLGGPHPTLMHDQIMQNYKYIDFIVRNEGEYTTLNLVNALEKKESLSMVLGISFRNGKGKVVHNSPAPIIEDLDALPYPEWKFFDLKKYIKWPEFQYKEYPHGSIITSRGCPNRCLSGDTVINTIDGDIPIKDLAGIKKIGVYTYDPKTQEVFITDGINCQKTGKNKDLVRVNFDDGTHIDCTPDHKFLTFKNKNQYVKLRKFETEAKDLKPHMSVQALKFYKAGKGYIEANWGRRKYKHLHRLVYEYVHKTKLLEDEYIHHIDFNKKNNKISNLKKTSKHEHIRLFHPELSERMKLNNPQKFCTKESYEKMRKKTTGLRRTLQQRINYRNSKLGKLNPNYTGHPKHNQYRSSRIKEINNKETNHRIVSVIPIGKADVYNLEVPATHWFFANNVLVHNCTFCSSNNFWGYRTRFRSAKSVVEEMKYLYDKFGMRFVLFNDDNFTTDRERAIEICKLIIKEGLDKKMAWQCRAEVSVITEELISWMKKANCTMIEFGVEDCSDVGLKWIHKGHTASQVKPAFDLCKKHGIPTKSYFIAGGDYETKDNLVAKKKYIDDLNPDITTMSTLLAYPKTEVFEIGKQKGLWDEGIWLRNLEGLEYSGNVPIYTGPNLTFSELNSFSADILYWWGKKKGYLGNGELFKNAWGMIKKKEFRKLGIAAGAVIKQKLGFGKVRRSEK